MKISKNFILSISFFILTISVSAQSPNTATEMNCYDQLKANNYSQAIEICTAVITAKDDSALAYRYRGMAYIYTNGFENYSKAEADFRKCVELNPTDTECHYWLGYSIGGLNNFSEQDNSRNFEDNKQPDDDYFSWNAAKLPTVEEMKFAYREAMARSDGYGLLRLAKIENDNQLLPDVKAGDILYNAYLIGLNRSPSLLFKIAKYENEVRIIENKKAGDILQEAYNFSRIRRDVRTMLEIALYENKENLMAAKAGDILYETYITARNNRDIRTMLRIADYEAELDLMTITPEQIRREATAIYN